MRENAFVRLSHDGPISVITMNRPEKMNAIDAEVLRDLEDAVAALDAHDETRVAILTGEGKAFVAGADIAAMQGLTPVEARSFSVLGHRIFAAFEALRVPVIAAVNGFALGGGCELALACDFIYASERAKFGQPEVGLGVTPGFGGTQRLPRRVGGAVARELIYTARIIGAEEAERIGLVNAVFAPDELMPAVMKTAREIVAQGPNAVGLSKRVIYWGEERTLGEASALEVDAFGESFESPEQREGMAAFVEKRTPSFRIE